MKKLFILFLIIGFVNSLTSQEGSTKGWPSQDQKTFEKANALFNKRQYELAYEKYKSLEANHEKDLFLKYVTGICCIYINDKQEEAEALLTEVKAKDKKAADIDYYMALLYHKTYQFDKALELANGLLTNPKLDANDKADLQRLVFYSKNGKELYANPIEAKIENLGSLINSRYAEYAPVITPDEEAIIFTYRGSESLGGRVDVNNKPDINGDFNEDILISKKVDKVWQKPERIEELNTIDNDAAIAIGPDGQMLFVFKESAGDNGDIYISYLEQDKFTTPVRLRGDVNTNSWEGSVTMSNDKKRIYFASERPGGFGGKDLYVAFKRADDSWGNVQNLGPNINTKYDEDAPYIHPDGRTLVFSSEGHNSMGDFDIFVSDMNEMDSTWKEPKNLGYPINTTNDDLFYVLSPDGKRGYFSSAKKGGMGDQDLYVVEPGIASKKSYITIIKGKVTENLEPYATDLSVTIEGESSNYGTYKSNPISGAYMIKLPSGFNYNIKVYHEILGEKAFVVKTEKVESYAEKIININYGINDTAMFNPQIIYVTDSENETKVTPPEKPVVFILSEADLIGKYGAAKIPGLNFYVQVAATIAPQKYNRNILKKLCKVKDGGTLRDNIKLLIADKEFDNLNEANDFLLKVRALGQQDAFITARLNGTRYYLVDLIKMKVWDPK